MSQRKVAVTALFLSLALVSGCGGSGSSPSGGGSSSTGSPSSGSASASPTASGVPFSSDQWHFSILFPKQPKQSAINQTVEGVKINGEVFDASSQDEGVAVSVVQFPPGQAFNVEAGLRGAVEGGAKTAGGTVTEQHAETFQGRQAREATVHIARLNSDIYFESVVDQTRLYTITGAPRDRFDAAKASFQFR